MKKRAFCIGIVLVMLMLFMTLAAATEGIPVYVVEEGHKNLTTLERIFSFLTIYGTSNIQIGKGGWTGSPPVLTNPTTNFKVGDTIAMVLTARDVRNGALISMEFCKEGGGCSPAKIFYFGGGSYTNEYLVTGNWDVWWIGTTFSAPGEGTWTINAYEKWPDPGVPQALLDRKTFTVSGMQCSPGTRTCDGDMVKICKSDGSGYEYEYCWYGCSASYCKPQPTPTPTPQICTPYEKRCSGNYLQQCSYTGYEWTNIEYCTYGCSGSYCLPAPTTPTPTYSPPPTVTPTYPPTSPSPTPTSTVPPPPIPGFSVLAATAGLLAGAYLIMRRRK